MPPSGLAIIIGAGPNTVGIHFLYASRLVFPVIESNYLSPSIPSMFQNLTPQNINLISNPNSQAP